MKRFFHTACFAAAVAFAVAAAVYFGHVVDRALSPMAHAVKEASTSTN